MNNHDGISGGKNSNSSIKQKAAVLSLMLLMIGGILIASSFSSDGSTDTAANNNRNNDNDRIYRAATSTLTPQERQEQNRLTNVTTAITRNLQQGEMQVNGIVYTPRWSGPQWVQPNSLSVLFVYCFPGEFADSGQQILGSRDLNVLESYSLALSPVLTGWLMVVENEHQTERIPAPVGVICTSDANDPESSVLLAHRNRL